MNASFIYFVHCTFLFYMHKDLCWSYLAPLSPSNLISFLYALHNEIYVPLFIIATRTMTINKSPGMIQLCIWWVGGVTGRRRTRTSWGPSFTSSLRPTELHFAQLDIDHYGDYIVTTNDDSTYMAPSALLPYRLWKGHAKKRRLEFLVKRGDDQQPVSRGVFLAWIQHVEQLLLRNNHGRHHHLFIHQLHASTISHVLQVVFYVQWSTQGKQREWMRLSTKKR